MAPIVHAATLPFASELAEQARIVREARSAAAGVSDAIVSAAGFTRDDRGAMLHAELLGEAMRDPEAREPFAEALCGLGPNSELPMPRMDFLPRTHRPWQCSSPLCWTA